MTRYRGKPPARLFLTLSLMARLNNGCAGFVKVTNRETFGRGTPSVPRSLTIKIKFERKVRMIQIIWWIIIGLIVGALARLVLPGRDPMGWIATILLGIAGSIWGGFVAGLLWRTGPISSTLVDYFYHYLELSICSSCLAQAKTG